MSISLREYAKSVGFKVVGKLTHFTKGETYGIDNRKQRSYIDEAGNEYYKSKDGCCIVTVEGWVI